MAPVCRFGRLLPAAIAHLRVSRGEEFEPPLESSVVRYTLGHPFLQPELHDPNGIYLFNRVAHLGFVFSGVFPSNDISASPKVPRQLK